MTRFEIQRSVTDPAHPWRHSGWIEAPTSAAAIEQIRHHVGLHQGGPVRSGLALSIVGVEDGHTLYTIYPTEDTGYWRVSPTYRLVARA